MKNKQVLLFLPVMHAGYHDFLARNANANEILLIGEEFGTEFPEVRKEIRAVSSSMAAQLVNVAAPGVPVVIVSPSDIALAVSAPALVVPDEALMRSVVDKWNLDIGRNLIWENTFLRWDRWWARPQRVGEMTPAEVSDDDMRLLQRARRVAGQSSDWWRQVGAVLVTRDGSELESHNQHFPTEYAPYIDGDPRNSHRRGERQDLSTAIHAEAALIGKAAARGLATNGGRIYVTTLPCPACARLLIEAGIRECYFEAPYSVLAGDQILRSAGVRLHWISAG